MIEDIGMKKSIESILGRIKREDFLQSYLQNQPVISHQNLDNFSEFTELTFLKSIDSLFESWPSVVTAYLPGIADEGNSKAVSVNEARELFERGSGLCFDDANNFSPLLSEWPQAIRSDLGLSALTYSRSLIYAIKKGRGTAAHFDQNINFVIQISGTKKWWVAPNEHVDFPLTRHTIGIDIDPELSSYIKSPMPESILESATEYTLEPGSVLFVPRGTWHTTEALSDAVSLNFTFSAPTWIDILTTALRGRLTQSSEWRETANFVSDEELSGQAIDKFEGLLLELTHDLPHWRAENILGATEMGSLE